MSWLTEYNLQQFLVFAFVLTRVSGLAMTAPIPYGLLKEVPMQIRALIAFALAVLIVPTQLGAHFPNPHTLVDLVMILGGELLIGVTLGAGIMILFSGIQLTGQIIGQVSGMTLADVFNPAFDTSIPLLSQMLYMFSLAIYVMAGGHRMLMAGLLDTFATISPGMGNLSNSLGDASITLLMQSFDLGIRAASAGDRRLAGRHLGVGPDQPHVAAVEHPGHRLRHQRHIHVHHLIRLVGHHRLALPSRNRACHRNPHRGSAQYRII